MQASSSKPKKPMRDKEVMRFRCLLKRPGFVIAAAFFFAGLSCGALAASAEDPDDPSVFVIEAPRVQAMLELGHAAEIGRGQSRSLIRAAMLYCDAAAQGSAEAYFRLGRMYLTGKGVAVDVPTAATLLSIAAGNGHTRAARLLEAAGVGTERFPECLTNPEAAWARFGAEGYVDIERYADALPAERRTVAALIRKLAPSFGVDARFALAIAAVESNFNPRARSPKDAGGVMQLIPATAERFGVKNVFDPEQNVRGGLAYLRWLLKRFAGDTVLSAAAYNAGEGAVDRYRGVPPYAETQAYVRRVARLLAPPSLEDVRRAVSERFE